MTAQWFLRGDEGALEDGVNPGESAENIAARQDALDTIAEVCTGGDHDEEQATPAHRHSVPHEPATTFIRGLQPVLQSPVT